MTDSTNEIPTTGLTGRRRILLYLAVLAVYAYFLIQEKRLAGSFGFSLDDSWIHAVFARNLARGDGFSFNPGHPVNGSTSMLWTLLLSVLFLLTDTIAIAAKVLGILLHLAGIELGRRTARLLAGDTAGWVAAVLIAFTPRLYWGGVSGMEVNLYVVVTLAALYGYLRARLRPEEGMRWGLIGATCAGAAVMVRPECLVLVAVFELDALRSLRANKLREALGRWAVLLALFAVYVGFQYAVGGKPLPQTFYAKAPGGGILGWMLSGKILPAVTLAISRVPKTLSTVFGAVMWRDNPFYLLLVPLGYWMFWERRRQWRTFSLPLATIALPAAFMLVSSAWLGQWQRYVFYLSPYFALLASLGVVWLAEQGKRRTLDRRVALALPGAALLLYGLNRLMIARVSNAYAYDTLAGMSNLGLLISLALGLVLLIPRLRRRMEKNIAWAIVLLCLPPLLTGIAGTGRMSALNVKNINEMQVTLGRWARTHTTVDSVLALNDIRAISYFSGRRILDLQGLVTPDAVPYRFRYPRPRELDGLWEYFLTLPQEDRPDYLIVFPAWYPTIETTWADQLQEVWEVELEDNTICGSERQVVYRTPWNDESRSTKTLPEAGGNDEIEWE